MKLKSPKLYLAPINKLSNIAFRSLCLKSGADFVFSELIHCEKLLEEDVFEFEKVRTIENEVPKTIFQIIAKDFETIEPAIKKLKALCPKLCEVNFNMGCPQSSLVKECLGGGILKTPARIYEVAKILKKCELKYGIVCSIKTRLGFEKGNLQIYEILENLEKIGLHKIYIHARFAQDTYQIPAQYSLISDIKSKFPNFEIILNGDITDTASFGKVLALNPDGIMIGRGALENPELFRRLKSKILYRINKNGYKLEERRKLLLKFLKLAKKTNLCIGQVKANLSYLTKSIVGANLLREQINNAKNLDGITSLFK